MNKSFHFSPSQRNFFLFFFMALLHLSGCGKLRKLYAHKESDNPHSVTITWTASNSPVAGYNVYRLSPSDGLLKLTNGIVSGIQYTDKTVEAGRTFTYYVTSVDSKGSESKPSEKVTVTVPMMGASSEKQ